MARPRDDRAITTKEADFVERRRLDSDLVHRFRVLQPQLLTDEMRAVSTVDVRS
jgi:hypothetical protein